MSDHFGKCQNELLLIGVSTFWPLFHALAHCVVQIHMASRKRPRLQCPLCKETLSYSAYCRHQQTQLCIPDKRCQSFGSQPQSKENEESSNSTHIDDITSGNDYQDSEHFSNYVSSSSQSSSDESNDSAPEIWDVESEMTPDDSTEPLPTTNITYILSYFLLFFQLCYHVSDRGLQHIINLISSLFHWVSVIYGKQSSTLNEFPKTIYSLKRSFGMVHEFDRYCVCTSCNTLYTEEASKITRPNNSQISQRCSYIEYPNHPQKSRRIKCGVELMKIVKIQGNDYLYPRKLFVFNSISRSLKKLAARPGFFESCELWRKLSYPDGSFMTDIYEGNFWKDWADYLKTKGNLLLMLNVDWFRPYKHTTYSIGVIYLVILNLPRTLRFKPENMIIIGTIPGPNEPKLTINTYLKPLVDKLLQLYTGICNESSQAKLGIKTVRVALACISADIPATRKVCGFYGFKAQQVHESVSY